MKRLARLGKLVVGAYGMAFGMTFVVFQVVLVAFGYETARKVWFEIYLPVLLLPATLPICLKYMK